jgi:hypothetical protein
MKTKEEKPLIADEMASCDNTSTTGDVADISTTSFLQIDTYGSPRFISAKEVGESVEFIYKEECLDCDYPYHEPGRVFKIVYSCKDGKWNKSERIYGTIIHLWNDYSSNG